MPRYTGTFRRETAGYGFVMDPKDAAGNPPPNLSPEGGVFLAASVAKRNFGGARGEITQHLDGKRLSVFVSDSSRHPGKLEASDPEEARRPMAL
jgi:hypothetical protein